MKKIVIVCEEKYRKYGDFLAQLVSADDDTDDEIVGVRDGEVIAQVWTEKDYNANAAQIASNQYILFIGNDKFVKEKSSTMPNLFSVYGMTCNSLGKQAVLMVTKSVSKDMYNDFLSYATRYQKNLEQVIRDRDNTNNIKTAGKITLMLAVPIVAYPMVGKSIFDTIERKKKIEEQQFSCAVMKFYLEYLADFMGM